MAIPEKDDPNRNRPVCYDRNRKKFITIDEILSGSEKTVSVDELTPDEQELLAIERYRTGPKIIVQQMSGPPMTNAAVIDSIVRHDTFGIAAVAQEMAVARNQLADLETLLREKKE